MTVKELYTELGQLLGNDPTAADERVVIFDGREHKEIDVLLRYNDLPVAAKIAEGNWQPIKDDCLQLI